MEIHFKSFDQGVNMNRRTPKNIERDWKIGKDSIFEKKNSQFEIDLQFENDSQFEKDSKFEKEIRKRLENPPEILPFFSSSR